jgi:F0F1-type ATP synthase membrane subunit a
MVFLEVLAYIFRTVSLGLRLAINLITGHILAKVCIGFIWKGYIKGVSYII